MGSQLVVEASDETAIRIAEPASRTNGGGRAPLASSDTVDRRHRSLLAFGGILHDSIMSHSIISDGEALQILKNDLRRLALEKHAAELNDASPERRPEIMAQIDREIEKELRKRSTRIDPGTLLH